MFLYIFLYSFIIICYVRNDFAFPQFSKIFQNFQSTFENLTRFSRNDKLRCIICANLVYEVYIFIIVVHFVSVQHVHRFYKFCKISMQLIEKYHIINSYPG